MEPEPFVIERIAPEAERYLARLPRKTQQSIAQAFDEICRSPFAHSNPTAIKPLAGRYAGYWRYRLGGLRIIYNVNREARTIRIVAIGPRGDIY